MTKLKTDTHLLQTTVTGSSGLFITNEDNMLLMSRYPDNYFDLAVVDPEYGIGDKFKGGSSGSINFNEIVVKGWDNSIPDESYFKELFRVSKNQIIWGGNYFIQYLNNTRCFVIWDKCISEDMSLSMCEMAWTSFDERSKIYKLYNEKGGKIHPTQKPVQLYKWILKNYAKEGFKIIDTHLGSGSHAIAVNEMNRFEKMNLTLTACEVDKEYYTDTTNRIINHLAQQSLF